MSTVPTEAKAAASNPIQSGTWQLVLQQEGEADREIILHGESYRIGRDSELEIALNHPAVSRNHAVLERDRNHWRLRDLNSTNGLWWQGRRIHELELRDGDRVSLAPAALSLIHI